MNKIEILQVAEMNDHYDTSKTRNGGGYHQPKYDFQYGEWAGVFTDTSCGDFGTRYTLRISNGNKTYRAGWGTMYKDWTSDFPDQFPEQGFYQAFEQTFDEKIPTENEV